MLVWGCSQAMNDDEVLSTVKVQHSYLQHETWAPMIWTVEQWHAIIESTNYKCYNWHCTRHCETAFGQQLCIVLLPALQYCKVSKLKTKMENSIWCQILQSSMPVTLKNNVWVWGTVLLLWDWLIDTHKTIVPSKLWKIPHRHFWEKFDWKIEIVFQSK